MKLNNFFKRTLTGIVFVALVAGSALINHYVFAAVFVFITAAALNEFYQLGKIANIKPQLIPGVVGGVCIYNMMALHAFGLICTCSFFWIIPLVVAIIIIELYRNKTNPFQNIAYTLTGWLYIVFPLAILNYFYLLANGEGFMYPGLLLAFFAILWVYDSMAYVIGIKFGRHRLFEKVSPKKSWEGFIGGMVFGMLTAYLASFFIEELGTLEWLGFGFLIIIFGTFGDLVESLLKRSIGVKDSGKILPGHGGVLDRFDAVLLSSPIIYVYLHIIS